MTLQEYDVILHRYFDFNEPKKSIEDKGIRDFSIDTIQLNGISFGYREESLVLKSLYLNIRKEDKIRITGNNGSGKSTVSKVLSLLHPPTKGSININSNAAHFYDQKALRKKIMLVTNHDVLLNETLRFNIAFDDKASTSKILELAKSIRFYDFIKNQEEDWNL